MYSAAVVWVLVCVWRGAVFQVGRGLIRVQAGGASGVGPRRGGGGCSSRVLLHTDYLLDWYKSTNFDAVGAEGAAPVQRAAPLRPGRRARV